MKGHSSNSRYRLKTKTVHGVRTGEHNNPHVMKAAARADGGMCDGKPMPKNLGKMGRMKRREDGGRVSGLDSDGEREREGAQERVKAAERKGGMGVLGTLGSALGTTAARKIPGPAGHIIRGIGLGGIGLGGMDVGAAELERQQAEKELRRLNREGRKDGGKVGRMHGGIVKEEEPPVDTTGAGAAGPIMGRGLKRGAKAGGGEVSDTKVGSKELTQHALEHKALAKKGD